MSFNFVVNLMLSRDLLELQSEEGREFFDAMNKVMEWAGKPNIADFFPILKEKTLLILKLLDPLGINSGMVHDMGRTMKIVEMFVKERNRERELGKEKDEHDFLDVLLDYKCDGKEETETISETNVVIAIMLEIMYITCLNKSHKGKLVSIRNNFSSYIEFHDI
ncbi:hypothetical protein HYC85_006818 [Camellia sinensis]|uniref:Cytochrome P450 n=1 Tax=Camellia sinensis TaxID=4442 RepID=A0A7J7HM71_CAMSI|nr:hypothetical protein HYC85_006818 [Camellia sinensis]